jgi:hypothetical protein
MLQLHTDDDHLRAWFHNNARPCVTREPTRVSDYQYFVNGEARREYILARAPSRHHPIWIAAWQIEDRDRFHAVEALMLGKGA